MDRTAGNEDELAKVSGATPTINYLYDPLYRATRQTDGNSHSSTQSFDKVGNLTTSTFPGYTSGNAYDSLHTSLFDPDYDPLTDYDGLNRRTDLVYNDPESLLTNVDYDNQGMPALDVSYTYDSYGRTTSRTDGAGEEEYGYDDLDEVTSVITTYKQAGGTGTLPPQEIDYTYNNDGSRATMNTPFGMFVYTYDTAGRLYTTQFPWTWKDTGGTSHNVLVKNNYYDNNWLVYQGAVNINDESALVRISYQYDARGRLTSQSNNAGDGTQLSAFGSSTLLHYDGADNLLGYDVSVPLVYYQGDPGNNYAAGLSGTLSFSYDSQDRLTQENSPLSSVGGGGNDFYQVPYDFQDTPDAADNLTTLRSGMLVYNADNQLSADTYDGDGNPTHYGSVSGLLYDPEDRLTSLPGYFTAGYFSDGRRAWKQTTSSSALTYYLYDGDTLLAELDSNGHLLSLYGWGAHGLIQRYSQTASDYYAYTFDPSGNVVQRTSHSGFQQGTLADFTTLYDGYGAQLGQISPLSEAQYPTPDLVGYGGEWGCVTDNETAPIGGGAQKSAVREPLVWMGHREYDPSVGRFVTRDPVGYEGGINVYAYTHNNPILHADPSGLQDVPGDASGKDPFEVYSKTPPQWIDSWFNALDYTLGFFYGFGPDTNVYKQDSQQLRDMKNSLGANMIRKQLRQIHYPNRTVPDPSIRPWNGVTSDEALFNTINQPLNATQATVGAFAWKARREGNMERIIIENDTTLNSFFYHTPGLFTKKYKDPNRSDMLFGFFGKVHQHFEWLEPVPKEFRNR